jgi:hypothetical protein
MIVAKTKLKKIPDSCLKCKFCNNTGIQEKASSKNGYLGVIYTQKRCGLTGIEVPYVYNASKRNWEYIKCQSCPLKEVEKNA